MNQTVVAVFNTTSEAHAALEQLATQGFDRSDIEIKSGPTAGTTAATSTGTTTGTTMGSTTTTGAHTDEGFFGSIGHFFSNMFGGDDHDSQYASHYTEAVRRGGAVLTLQTDEARVSAAHDALQLAGAVDIDEQVGTWKQSGYAGTTASSAASSMPSVAMGSSSAMVGGETVVPVIQEELEVGKRRVEGGVVRVTSRVTSRPVHESVDLTRETASIERRPVDRVATDADLSGFQDRTIEVKESAEKAVVNKSSHVVEEVVVGKQVSHETQNIDDTVRRTEVDVDRDTAGVNRAGTSGSGSMAATPFPDRTAGSSAMSGTTASATMMGTSSGAANATGLGSTPMVNFDDHAADFRSHYGTNYASSGSYDDFEPAYRSGFSMRDDNRYSGQDWDAIEPQARANWEGKNPGTWEKMKGAVQQGWRRTIA